MSRAFNESEGVVCGVICYDTVIWYMVTDVSEAPAAPIFGAHSNVGNGYVMGC
jgi:hypothetical protein